MSLWEHTCFEFFIGADNSTGYYEFNLSPSGDWNSFTFSDVRKDRAETPDLVCTHSSAGADDDCRLTVTSRARFVPPGGPGRFRVGVSAVIEQTDGKRCYFALSHDGNQPDFHRRSNHRMVVE